MLCSDKIAFEAFARAEGIPVPRTYLPDELEELLMDEEGLEGMPILTGMSERERKALLIYLAPRLKGGAE